MSDFSSLLQDSYITDLIRISLHKSPNSPPKNIQGQDQKTQS